MILFPYPEFNLYFPLRKKVSNLNRRPEMREHGATQGVFLPVNHLVPWVRTEEQRSWSCLRFLFCTCHPANDFLTNCGSIRSPARHINLCDNPQNVNCSKLGPDSWKNSCEGMWTSWKCENTQTDQIIRCLKGKSVETHPSYWTQM